MFRLKLVNASAFNFKYETTRTMRGFLEAVRRAAGGGT